MSYCGSYYGGLGCGYGGFGGLGYVCGCGYGSFGRLGRSSGNGGYGFGSAFGNYRYGCCPPSYYGGYGVSGFYLMSCRCWEQRRDFQIHLVLYFAFIQESSFFSSIY
ncbi:hypothetical protein GW7_19571 [Heterocephalus glaber]|uniref:Uncharacterized protein n=1 Tax=Heterocephalus glaber TaxID=10181 RepID=G5AZV3_HETGA|nr:hypothetical protein GW7_19571 [Heterocephalus glaber]